MCYSHYICSRTGCRPSCDAHEKGKRYRRRTLFPAYGTASDCGGIFLLMIFGTNGMLGGLLASIGMSVVFTWQGAVIAAAAVSFPIMYRTARGALEQVDENLINAGRTLGMSESRIFFKILLPMSRPGIAAAAILSFARALGEFGATMMLAGNIPGRTQTMSIAIYTAMQGGNREKAYVWVAVIMAMSFGVMILMNLWNDRQNRRKKI